MRARLERNKFGGFAAEELAESLEKFLIEILPDIERAKSDAVLVFENPRDALCRGANKPEGNVLAHAERKASESRNLAPRQRARSVLAVFALDGPILAGVGFRDEVDALVIRRKAEFFAQGGWHFIQKPNLAQLGGVFWIKKQIRPNEVLEDIALLLFGHAAQPIGEILPRGTTLDRFNQQGIR
jgi:hypothetical protein